MQAQREAALFLPRKKISVALRLPEHSRKFSSQQCRVSERTILECGRKRSARPLCSCRKEKLRRTAFAGALQKV
jgi:hypothetical protein